MEKRVNTTALVQELRGRLPVEGAAAYLGLAKSTLNRMRTEGRGPRYVKLGGRVFYRKADLDAYIEAAVVETTESRALAG